MSTWLEQIAQRAAEAPDRWAATFEDSKISYGELDRRSNQLAHCLRARGAKTNSLIGLHLDRGLELLVALLGVVRAGCAYVPLDPLLPPQRLEHMLEDAKPLYVLTTSAQAPQLGQSPVQQLELDAASAELAAASSEPLALDLPPETLAYVIFTSGSTGRPKGVAVPHCALDNYLKSMARVPGLTSTDKNLALATFAFDMSLFDFWLPLTVGAHIEIGANDLGRDARRLKQRLEREDITFLHATPTTLRLLIEVGWQGHPGLRVLSGGEAMTRELADAVLLRASELYNGYGPTETTVCATLWKVPATGDISIGSAVDNALTYVLDDSRKPVPVGSEGELWVGGAGVATGYLGREDLTRERFIRDPFCSEPDARMYKTGDLVREDEAGLLYFLGRADDQVKIRGYRIELAEVEDAIASAQGAGNVAVTVHRNQATGEEQLTAFVAGGADQVPLGDLLAHARERLPGYMVPTHIERLDELPRMPSGKLDRRSLPEPTLSATPPVASLPPEANTELEGDLEKTVALAFEEVLSIQGEHALSDFFDLGGTSLLAARLQLALEGRLGSEVELGAIFEGKTIRGIAELLAHQGEGHSPRLLALRPNGEAAPVFCVLGIHYYQELADCFSEVDRPWYGAYLPLEQEFFGRHASSQERGELLLTLARRYADSILERRPSGPYCLLGHSTGGIIAFEIARCLLEAGHEVERLILLDTVLMNGVERAAKHHFKQGLRSLRRSATQSLLHWSGSQLDRLGQGVPLPVSARRYVRYSQTESDALHRMRVYEGAEEYWEKHLAKPCKVNTVFVHAQQRCDPVGYVAANAGWSDLIEGELQVLEVDCEHADLVRTPHVQELARVLQPVMKTG